MTEATGWYSDEIATLGDRLAAAREGQGLSQADLARRLGVREKTLAHWEDDASEPRANRVQMLAGMLGVSLRWLLTGEGDGPGDPDAVVEPPVAVAAYLAELRNIHTGMAALSARLGLAEKRLRRTLAETAA